MTFTMKIGLDHNWASFQEVHKIDAVHPLMYFALNSCTGERQSFEIFSIDRHGNENGYGLEKSPDGYFFWLACNKPFNGFSARPGFWAFKVGASNKPCRWHGGGDFAWRPKRMFLTFDIAQRLVLQLNRGEPMRYDPEYWENTDDSVLEPPT